ncbi:MAG: DNA methyltransferase [Actinomycetota bacterium]
MPDPTDRRPEEKRQSSSTLGPIRDRIVDLRRVRAGDLLANFRNWRRHPDRQRRALVDLMRTLGIVDSLIARELPDGSLELIDGHLRKDLDPDLILPVQVVDLDEDEANLLLATLDPVAAMAEPDPAALEALLSRIEISSSAVNAMLDGLAREAKITLGVELTDPDDIPPVPKSPKARPGEVWELGPHRIACADATDPDVYGRLLGGSPADVLWTDPPYGVGYVGKTPRALQIAGDDASGLASLLARSFSAVDGVLRRGSGVYVCSPSGALSMTFATAFVDARWQLRQTLIWRKDCLALGRSDYHYIHEPILYGCKPGSGRWGRGHDGWFGGNAETSVFEIPRPRASRDHPTAKPVELVRRCLQNSSMTDAVVLDPFLGGGSTLIAAEQLQRRCVGIEIDPGYVDVAIARWEAFTGREARRL